MYVQRRQRQELLIEASKMHEACSCIRGSCQRCTMSGERRRGAALCGVHSLKPPLILQEPDARQAKPWADVHTVDYVSSASRTSMARSACSGSHTPLSTTFFLTTATALRCIFSDVDGSCLSS